MSDCRRILLIRTVGEWSLIERRIRLLGKYSDLNSYLRCEISNITILFEESPSLLTASGGDKVKRAHIVNNDDYKILQRISEAMKIPESTVVDRLLIQRLLFPEKLQTDFGTDYLDG